MTFEKILTFFLQCNDYAPYCRKGKIADRHSESIGL